MGFRRLRIMAVAAAVALMGAGSAIAQSYPVKPVRMIVPFAPGGRVEAVARILALILLPSFRRVRAVAVEE